MKENLGQAGPFPDDQTQTPSSTDHLFEMLRYQFDDAVEILHRTPVETKEDAINREFHHDAMSAIKFRRIDPDYDNRDQYLAFGRSLLPYIDWAIDTKQLTPEFVQKWGLLSYCHGYIAAYYFDNTNDFGPNRAPRDRRASQQQWYSKLFMTLRTGDPGLSAKAIHGAIFKQIKFILANYTGLDPAYREFEETWYSSFLKSGGKVLRSTYTHKLSEEFIAKCAAAPATTALPPVEVLDQSST